MANKTYIKKDGEWIESWWSMADQTVEEAWKLAKYLMVITISFILGFLLGFLIGKFL